MTEDTNKGFEKAYQSEDFAGYYGSKHDASAALRFRDSRERRMWSLLLRSVGEPEEILDCPAGAGRFWPFLRTIGGRLTAVDTSSEMIESGCNVHPESRPDDTRIAFAQELPFDADSFDLVFCSRLLHHFPLARDRRDILKSFARVSRRFVAFSTWRTGNLASFRKQRRTNDQKKATRFYTPMREICADAEAAGLEVIKIAHKQRLISPIVAVLCQVVD